jgi:hypothetical protein
LLALSKKSPKTLLLLGRIAQQNSKSAHLRVEFRFGVARYLVHFHVPPHGLWRCVA